MTLLPFFPPITPFLNVEQLLHGLMGEKKTKEGKNIIYFPPVGFFVLFLAR